MWQRAACATCWPLTFWHFSTERSLGDPCHQRLLRPGMSCVGQFFTASGDQPAVGMHVHRGTLRVYEVSGNKLWKCCHYNLCKVSPIFLWACLCVGQCKCVRHMFTVDWQLYGLHGHVWNSFPVIYQPTIIIRWFSEACKMTPLKDAFTELSSHLFFFF
jgi:hypothetical protein